MFLFIVVHVLDRRNEGHTPLLSTRRGSDLRMGFASKVFPGSLVITSRSVAVGPLGSTGVCGGKCCSGKCEYQPKTKKYLCIDPPTCAQLYRIGV